MTKPTRLFLVISGSILVVGLGTGLVAAYVGGGLQNLTLIGSPGPDELAYISPDTRMVAFANVREIMDSELHEKLRGLQPRSGQGLAAFEAQTGVDVTRDVDYVLAAGFGGAPDMAGQGQRQGGPPLVMVRGRFDAVRIEGLVRSKGGVVEEYKGIRLVTHADNGMAGALAFLEPGLLAMGGAAAVKTAIDTQQGHLASVTGNKELMRLVREGSDGNVWAVARFDAIAPGRLPAEVAGRLPAINWVTMTGHVNGGIQASLRAETGNDAAAKNLRDMIQGILALAKMQTGTHAGFADVVNSIELGGDGKNVSLSMSLPVQAIDLLVGLHAGRPRPDASPDASPDSSLELLPAPPEAPAVPEP
jgi:hypothetical protein